MPMIGRASENSWAEMLLLFDGGGTADRRLAYAVSMEAVAHGLGLPDSVASGLIPVDLRVTETQNGVVREDHPAMR